jgi:hypothetical protein
MIKLFPKNQVYLTEEKSHGERKCRNYGHIGAVRGPAQTRGSGEGTLKRRRDRCDELALDQTCPYSTTTSKGVRHGDQRV